MSECKHGIPLYQTCFDCTPDYNIADMFDNLEDHNLRVREDDSLIAFHPKEGEVLKLTGEGFIYKGELIKDAGEAHKLFIKVMNQMKYNNESTSD